MSRTITVTQQISRHLNKPTPYKLRLDPDNDPDDDSPSSSSSSISKSNTKTVTASRIIRILYQFHVSSYDNMTYVDNPKKTSYRLLKMREPIYDVLMKSLDPKEVAELYKQGILTKENKVVWENAYLPKSVFLVRHEDHSMSFVQPSKARESRNAWSLYEFTSSFRRLSKYQKEVKSSQNHYHFEAVERNAMRLVQDLASCTNQHQCARILKSACMENTRHPDLVKAVYRYASKAGIDANLSWNDICSSTI